MRVTWIRRLLLAVSLGVVGCLGFVVALAAAPAPPTLDGETLIGGTGSGSPGCPTPTFTVTGGAGNPYPGTFSEAGSWTDGVANSFSATFTIIDGATTIIGSKSGGGGGCSTIAAVAAQTGPYAATIHTPSGNFRDEGTFTGQVTVPSIGQPAVSESFSSSLTNPVPLAPTSKAQCLKNGWKNFAQFKNQGDCVSFVASGGKNQPAG